MSKAARNSTIGQLLESLSSAEGSFENKTAAVTDERMEELSAEVQELAEAVDKQFEEDEAVLDEENDGEVERLEAIENAKDTLYELSDAIAELGKDAARIRYRFEEIRNSLNESKEA